jgi:hypothetical protein
MSLGFCGRPRLGTSSCLLGEEVRFNGGHKRYRFLTDSLDRYVDWVPYCPEVSIGLGTPREAIRLTAAGRLVNRELLTIMKCPARPALLRHSGPRRDPNRTYRPIPDPWPGSGAPSGVRGRAQKSMNVTF